MSQFVASPRTPQTSRLTVRFIVVAGLLYGLSGTIAAVLIRFVPNPPSTGRLTLPPVFWITTGLLAVASAELHYSVQQVRRERQRLFRRSLGMALIAGTLFVAFQACGLRFLMQNQIPDEVQTGSAAFVTMLVALHAMHLMLALLFLVWVTLSAFADRYDHEYYWSVSVCAWFWHALGAVWLVILAVFMIVGANPIDVLNS